MKYVITFLLTITVTCYAAAQKIVIHNPVFETQTPQSMWGPSDAPGLNTKFVIFPEYSFRQNFSTGDYTMLSFGGMDFGVDIRGKIGFGVGPFEFDISGFSAGEIEVMYPATVQLEMPDDNTYNPGETIVIKSSFQADPGAELKTTYPKAGTIGLTMGLMFDAALGVQMCFIQCLPFLSLIPPPGLEVDDPIYKQKLVFFQVDSAGLTYLCDDFASGFQCQYNSGFPPWTVSAGAFGGMMNIPNVSTTSSIVNNRDLYAEGADPYVTASLDVVTLLGYLPPPVKVVAALLHDDIEFRVFPDVTGTKRGIAFEWTLLGINLDLPIRQTQNFSFEPRVYTRLFFPDTVDYMIHSTREGPIPGRATTFEFEVGDSVSVRFPCNYDFMDVTATHRIGRNTMRNKTFDNISLELKFKALEFKLTIDPYVIIPEICIPLPFGLDFCIPEIGFPGEEIPIGPLIDPDPIPLVSMDFPPYFQDEWELGGFNQVEVEEPFRMSPRKRNVDFVTTNVTCHGDSTGTIETILLDASAPLTYEWSFGSTDANPINVPAGSHHLKITDVNRCESIEPVVITQPPAIDIDITNTPVLCFGGTSTVTATTAGGSGALSMLWDSGETTASVTKTAGTFYLTVTDASACVTIDSVSIPQPLELVAKIATAVDPSCANADDGSLTLFVEGGSAPYQFLWSNGSSQRDQKLLEGGAYTITVTDAHNCIQTDAHTLIEPTALETILIKISDVSCYGGSDGALDVIASGGSAPYTYQWYDSLVTLSERSASVIGLDRGSYSVEVTDDHNCKSVKNVHVTQPSRPLQADIIPVPGPCNGQSAGRLDLIVQGGTSPYQYDWSNGGVTEDLMNVPAGEYDVTVTDANGCINRNKTLLADPKPLRASISKMDVTCADQKDGQVMVNQIAGGVGPYDINWSTGETGEMIEGLDVGTYSVTIIDAVGCEFSEAYVIDKNDIDCLFIPNAFSPNSDNTNDTWNIRNIHLYTDAEVKVYNKWGTMVFESLGYTDQWDGTNKGKDLEASTYYYVVDLHNGHAPYQGYVVILR